jgi:prolyl oligopeptidase
LLPTSFNDHEVSSIVGRPASQSIQSLGRRYSSMMSSTVDPRPTLAAPDDHPWTWLEEMEDDRALAWVAAQKRDLITTLQSSRGASPDWETLLDLDALAEAEGEDWVFRGGVTRPGRHDRAILHLSGGGSDACVLREYDITGQRFVPGLQPT